MAAKIYKFPREILEEGAQILKPFLESRGFEFQLVDEGRSSGGYFAHGEFVSDERKLELHYRHSLGMVRYHFGPDHVTHKFYMAELGVADKCRYPGFSQDPLEGFRHLLHDLEKFGDDFFSARCPVLLRAAFREWGKTSTLNEERMAQYVGDATARAKAREMFAQDRYDEVVKLYDSLQYPHHLEDSEERMFEIARRRSGAGA